MGGRGVRARAGEERGREEEAAAGAHGLAACCGGRLDVLAVARTHVLSFSTGYGWPRQTRVDGPDRTGPSLNRVVADS